MIYAHAMLAGAVALVLFAPSHTAGVVGAGLLAAMLTLIAMCAGVVMGNRLHHGETPLPPMADIDRQLSGQGGELTDDIQEQLDLMAMLDDSYGASSLSMTAPESRHA